MILLQKESKVNQVIPDKGSLIDIIKIHHGINIQSLKVTVDIEHPFIGDLKVALTSPTGTSVTLYNRGGGSNDNLKHTFEGAILESFLGETAEGEWALEVQDFAPRDEGSLISWGLEINCENSGNSEIFIPEGEDNWLISQQICRLSGIIEDAQLTVNIEHPFASDLIVKLKSPDGEEITVHNRQGGASDNINTSYNLDVLGALKGKNTEGVWSLLVKDAAPRDSGTLKHWKIAFSYQQIDDLTALGGVTPEYATLLNGHGIYSFNKLATLGTAGLRDILTGTEADLSYDGINSLLDAAKTAAIA